jgi:hypothetical protein
MNGLVSSVRKRLISDAVRLTSRPVVNG